MASLQGIYSNALTTGSASQAGNLLSGSNTLAAATGAGTAASSSSGLTSGSSSSTASGSSSSTSSSSSTLKYDDFLTLFCTQLQYQDPTNPMESYELAAQLAQFSTVEQLTEANTNLVTIESYLASLNNTGMIDLVGKEVVGTGGNIQVGSGTVIGPSYTLPASSSSSAYGVTIKIYDSDDNLVQTLSLSDQSAGTYAVNWDGTNSSGSTVDDGQYYCTVSAEDSNGSTSTITAANTGTVYSFVMDSSSPYVILDSADGIRIPIANLYEITTDSESS